MSPSDPRRGIVLVTVLWTIALLSALAMAASVSFRGFAGIVAVNRDKVVADAMLNAGIEVAAGILRGLGDEPLTDRETSVSLSSGIVRIKLSDEGGRIDINKASVKVIASLLRSAGAEDDADVIASVIDGMRASVAMAPSSPASAAAPQGDSSQQADLGVRAFTDTHQLAQIPGMAPEYLTAIMPLTTVFGYDKINLLTASRDVIAALPAISDGQIAALLDARQSPLSPNQLQQLLGPSKDYVKFEGRPVAAVELTVKLLDGYSTRVTAVMMIASKDRQPYRVLAWTPVSASGSHRDFADAGLR